nr:translocation/assembly module TamB [Rikenellaceae bacterium]
YLRLNSDFADLELQGRRSYRNIFHYFKNTVRKYLPALQNPDMRSVTDNLSSGGRGYDVPSAPPSEPDTLVPAAGDAMSDYYIARLNVKSATGVADIFVPGLSVAEGTSASFLFNPTLNRFSLSLKSDYIMKGDNIVSNLNIDSRSDADSISLFVRAGDVVAGNLYFPDVSVFGGIRNNSVGLYGRFENRGDGSAAFIASRSRFAVDPNTGLTRLYVNMLPGYVRLSGQTWNIRNSVTALDSTGIEVNRFVITDGRQSVTVDGKASRSVADTLTVRISGFDISPLSALVDTMGYALGGTLDGDVRLVSLLRDPFFLSDIDIRRFTVNGHLYPDVSVRSLYDERNRDILYDMTAGDSLRLVTGMFHLPDGSYRAEIELPDVDLSVLSPMLRGISSGVSGEADVSLTLTEKNDFPCFNGTVDIRGFATTIDFTKVRYSVSGKAVVKDNMVSMTGATLTDELGTVAPFEASATHTRFKRVNYKIRALPKNMLCMNTSSRDNELFFGRVFASGDMSVTGRGKAVTMVVNAATEEQSTFNMPLSDKSTMKEADFITFIKPQVEESLTRRLIRERDRKMSSTGMFDIRLNIDVRPNTYAQIVIDPTIGDIIKVRGEGQLIVDARPSTGEFSINGGYEIVEGGYLFTLQNLINKYFTIEQGSNIKWNGDPLGADLNITATYKVKASLAPLLGSGATNFNRRADVDCNIKLTGQLLHPDVQLGITVPNADPETQSMISSALNTEEAVSLQLFWLLLANTFYADASTQSESTVNVGLANSVAVTGLEFLSNQIGNWLSGDKFNLGFSYRPKDAMSSDELELSISAPLLKDKLYLDAEGNVNFKNNTAYINDDVGNLSGDASLTWILDNSGNIRMKAFTRQINTFDENQGLQESGVGIYYKEDFNRFGDVVRKFRAQMSEIERRREERRAVKDSVGGKVYRDSVRDARRADRDAARKQDETVRSFSRSYRSQ